MECYQKFILHRAQVARKLGKKPDEVEKSLYYGTIEKSAMTIATTKFDRIYAGSRRKDGKLITHMGSEGPVKANFGVIRIMHFCHN